MKKAKKITDKDRFKYIGTVPALLFKDGSTQWSIVGSPSAIRRLIDAAIGVESSEGART